MRSQMLMGIGNAIMHCFKRGDSVVPVDYHIHTTYSDGKNSIEKCIIEAKRKGLIEIAITDHVWRTSEWVDDYVNEIRELAEKHGYTVHAGLEAKVVDFNGNVDVSRSDRKKVDFVIGVVHRRIPDEEKPYNDLANFSAEKVAELEIALLKKLAKSKHVDVIGHPTRIYQKLFPNADVDDIIKAYAEIRKFLKIALKCGKVVEYNSKLLAGNELLELYLEEGVAFTIGSDAHSVAEIGKIDYDGLSRILRGEG